MPRLLPRIKKLLLLSDNQWYHPKHPGSSRIRAPRKRLPIPPLHGREQSILFESPSFVTARPERSIYEHQKSDPRNSADSEVIKELTSDDRWGSSPWCASLVLSIVQ